MKKRFLPFLLLAALGSHAQSTDYSITGVPFTQVKLNDHFWLPRIQTNRTVTIPASFQRCESTGRVKNFEMAAAKSGKFCTTFPFDDTDIYKTLEGASYSLSVFPDPALSKYLDTLIDKIAKAQEPDGYLYTARTIDPVHPHAWAGQERWVKEAELSHELYNAGHLYEAAVAHYQATGKKNLLNIALKNADLICSVFGPGKRSVAPGHEIVEMGLVKLYRVTGDKKYLETAKFFIEQRGQRKDYDAKNKNPWKNGSYWQDDKSVYDQTEAEGHAVRAEYLYSGMADVAALTGDQKMIAAIDNIWNNVVGKKMYVQGSVGAIPDGERFGDNYDLPNTTAYNETCAAIAGVYWNQRMFMLHGESKYIDVLEKTLYNGLISGIGLDGKSFFYTNAMQITNNFSHTAMEPVRSGWFDCSCCPTNLARFIPALPGYVYAQKGNDVYVNLFISGDASVNVNGKPVQIKQENNYPWDGNLSFTIDPKKATPFNLLVRIPGWANNEAMPSSLYNFQNNSTQKTVVKINGNAVEYTIDKGYAVLNRTWKKGDKVEVILPMEIRKVVASSNIKNDINKVALQRGPLMYCGEWKDNDGRVSNIILPETSSFTSEYNAALLNGVTVLKAQVPAVDISNDGLNVSTRAQSFTAIPYYAWANRGKGEMMIWFPEKVKDVQLMASDEVLTPVVNH
ncbi:glycoside hydrolase family 127 protein [Chitinophagaceae bacterium 26-R-25]|nr:glycoside hydrolase family 127 protein [Chitinophagaceae bacterium 26-R-25]